MLRIALEEYVAARLAEPSTKEFVQAHLRAPTLKLHSEPAQSDKGAPGEGHT